MSTWRVRGLGRAFPIVIAVFLGAAQEEEEAAAISANRIISGILIEVSSTPAVSALVSRASRRKFGAITS